MTKFALMIAGALAVVACGGKAASPSTTTSRGAVPSSAPSSSAPSAVSSTSAGSPSEPIEEQIAEFRGSGETTTKEFEVKLGWELRWEVEGDHLGVTLVDKSGRPVDELVNQDGTGGGSVYPRQTGTYSLHMTGQGDWLIRVFNHS